MLVHAVASVLAQHGMAVAIVTGEESCIAGGLAAQVAPVSAVLAAAGAHVTPLPVEVASHTRLMAGAVTPFAHALHTMGAPMLPVLAGVDAARVATREQAIGTLARQLAEPIIWDQCMDACAEAGITVALELGPGAALARMLQARHPAIACRSVAEFRSVDGIRRWLERQ
jgi:[acyl-carrier-protein] S-malonyltransferase